MFDASPVSMSFGFLGLGWRSLRFLERTFYRGNIEKLLDENPHHRRTLFDSPVVIDLEDLPGMRPDNEVVSVVPHAPVSLPRTVSGKSPVWPGMDYLCDSVSLPTPGKGRRIRRLTGPLNLDTLAVEPRFLAILRKLTVL